MTPDVPQIIVSPPRSGEVIIPSAANVSFWGGGYYGMDPFNHIEGNLYVGGIIDDVSMFKYVFCLTPDKTYFGNSKQIIHLAAFADAAALPDAWLIDDLVDRIDECTKRGPTYVHCTAGVNRSVMLTALVMIKWGQEPAEVVRKLRAIRGPELLSNITFLRRVLHGRKEHTH